jgi:hypothetical protein
MLQAFDGVVYILLMKRGAQCDVGGRGKLGAIRRFHDLALDRHATGKSCVLGEETNPDAVAGRLDFDRDIFEEARGKQTIDGVGDILGAEEFPGFEGLGLGQIRWMEGLRFGKLDVYDAPAFKL